MKQSKFKETEIGEIPEEWNAKPLSNISQITMGQSPPSSTYNVNGRGLPFFQGRKDFGQKYPSATIWCSEPKRIAEKDEVLVSVRAPIGDVNIASEKCCIGRGLASLSMHKNESEFLYYLLKHAAKRLKFIYESEGTVFGCLTRDGIRNFKIPFPSKYRERRVIAKIFSDLDSKIELNNEMNRTLEFIGQVLFKHWFVDFEFPNDEVKPYRSSGGEMVDSELGRIPKRWFIGPLGGIMDVASGRRPGNKSDRRDSHFRIPLIGASSVMGYVKESLCDERVLIIGRVGTHGVVQRITPPSFPSDNTLIIKSKFYEYIYQILKTINYDSLNVGTTQPLITQSSIKNLRAAIPPESILEEFERTVSRLFRKVNDNNDETETLSSVRDSLLPRLMSGRIRVPIRDRAI